MSGDMFDDTAMQRMLLRWKGEQLSADGKIHIGLRDSDTSDALSAIAAVVADHWVVRWAERLDELDDDEQHSLMMVAIVAKLLDRLASQAAEGTLRVAWRPCDNDVFWHMPHLNDPDEDGNCTLCGSPIDYDDDGDES